MVEGIAPATTATEEPHIALVASGASVKSVVNPLCAFALVNACKQMTDFGVGGAVAGADSAVRFDRDVPALARAALGKIRFAVVEPLKRHIKMMEARESALAYFGHHPFGYRKVLALDVTEHLRRKHEP